MPKLVKLPAIFLISGFMLLCIASVAKIDKYETNTLLSFNENYSKLFLSPDSFKCMKLQNNSWFNYYEGGKNMTRKVVSIQDKSNGYEVILDDKLSGPKLITISYKSGSQSLLSAIFKN